MHIDMYIDTQFSIFLINKPGVLAQTLNELAKEKVNVVPLLAAVLDNLLFRRNKPALNSIHCPNLDELSTGPESQ